MTGVSMVPQVGQVGSLSPSPISPKLASAYAPGTTRKWTLAGHPQLSHTPVAGTAV